MTTLPDRPRVSTSVKFKRAWWLTATYAHFFFGVHFTAGYISDLLGERSSSLIPGWLCPFIAAAWFMVGVMRLTDGPEGDL